MPIVSPPRVGRIYWTAYTQPEGDSSPIDPLRFDMYGARLGNVLLPGITNRVERLRYFGMVCAGLLLTRPPGLLDGVDQARRWRQAFLSFEAGWALSNLLAVDGRIKDEPPNVERPRLNTEFQGLRGANRVLAYYRTVRDQARIKPTGYRLLKAQEAQGGLGAYLVALRRYGFVQNDRFDLTAAGHELGKAFLQGARRAHRLFSPSAESRSKLREFGELMLLPKPSRAEAEIVNSVLFEGSDRVATVFGRIPARLRTGGSAREALASFASSSGDSLERAAAYALAFDPFRHNSLAVFSELGRQLESRGSAPLADLDTDLLEQRADGARSSAAALVHVPPVDGLEPVHAFATRVAGASSNTEAIHAVVSFHRQEGRRWIESTGPDRYQLGTHGTFAPPGDDFHGYTVRSAMRIYRDVREALA